ncbi:MAG: S8 family serine peptidase, partial [Actinomycetota bacterium]
MRRTLVALLLAAVLVPVAWAGQRGTADAATLAPVAPVPQDPAGGPYIVQLRPGTDTDAFLAGAGVAPGDAMRFTEVFNGFAAVLTQEQARAVAADPRTAAMEVDAPVRTMVDQSISPTGANNNWGLDRIDQRNSTLNGTYSYDAAKDGTGVTAYVLDTGVYAAHSDFGGRVTAGWSYRAQSYFFTTQADHGNKVPLGDNFLGVTPGSDWCTTTGHPYNDGDLDAYDRTLTPGADGTTDNNGHGTHVAGIIGGSTHGVAKSVTIVPVQALNSCGAGIASMVVKGIEWILTNHTGSNKAVVNMSIGFDVSVNSIDCSIHGPQPAIGKTCSGYTNWLFNEGIVAVAASGNAGAEDCTASPGSTYGTIAVGASGAAVSSSFVADAEPSYTNYGRCVDVFAPGSYVKSAWTATSGSPTEIKSGSSMASPHVAGVVAGWLESQTAPGTLSTWPTLAWQHIKRTATCGAVTYYDASRTYLTPNRLLYAGTDVSVPCAPASVSAVAGSAQATVTWKEVAAGNGAEVSAYTV